MFGLYRVALCLLLVAASQLAALAVDGLSKEKVIRPRQIPAKIKGCHIADTKPFTAEVGDVIELDYTYPVVPGAFPSKVSLKQTPGGAVEPSALGNRMVVVPRIVGASTIGFFLEAKKAGQETVTVVIDDHEYEYTVKVH